jgi:hypothetical protein
MPILCVTNVIGARMNLPHTHVIAHHTQPQCMRARALTALARPTATLAHAVAASLQTDSEMRRLVRQCLDIVTDRATNDHVHQSPARAHATLHTVNDVRRAHCAHASAVPSTATPRISSDARAVHCANACNTALVDGGASQTTSPANERSHNVDVHASARGNAVASRRTLRSFNERSARVPNMSAISFDSYGACTRSRASTRAADTPLHWRYRRHSNQSTGAVRLPAHSAHNRHRRSSTSTDSVWPVSLHECHAYVHTHTHIITSANSVSIA